jgi:hypothetical protein
MRPGRFGSNYVKVLARLGYSLHTGDALSVTEGDVQVVDAPGFHVDADWVDEAATGIKQSVDDQDNFELRGLCGGTELYGHTGVHDALMDFCVRWSDGLDTLTGDAGAIGDALSKATQAYRGIDQNTIRTLTGDPGEQAVEGG